MSRPDLTEGEFTRLLRDAYGGTPSLAPAARVRILERTAAEVRNMARKRTVPRVRRVVWVAAAAGLVLLLALGAIQLLYPREQELATLQVQAGPVELERTRTRVLWFRETTVATLEAGEVARVAAGDRVRTGPGASALLTFHESSAAALGPAADVAVTQLHEGRGDQPGVIALQLWAGQASATVQRTDSRRTTFSIDTPAVSAVAVGTEFVVEAIAPDHTYLATAAGTVEVEMEEQQAALRAGEELDAILGQPLTVRSQTPPVPIVDPLPGTVSTSAIAVSGRIHPAPLSAPAARVELYVNDVLETTLPLDEAGTFAYTYVAPRPGSYLFHAVALSARGRAGPPSDAVSTKYEKALPALSAATTALGPLQRTGLGEYATREAQVTLVGEGIPGETVVLYLDGAEVARVQVGVDGRFLYPFSAPAEGIYRFTAAALDEEGHRSAEVPLATIVHDVTQPILRLTTFPGDEVTVERATIAGQTEPGAALTMNGAAVAVDEDGSFSFEVALVPGPNPIHLVATDAAGNAVSSTSTILRQ